MIRKSKIGFHSLAGYDHWQYIIPALQRGMRGWLTLEEHMLDLLPGAIPAVDFPAARIIWPREQVDHGYKIHHDPHQWLEYVVENRPFVLELGEMAAAHGKSIGLAGHNEPPDEVDIARAYGEFEATRAGLLSPYPGLHAIVGNWGVGRTSPEMMDAFLSPHLLNAIWNRWATLGLHEYWYLVPWTLIDRFQAGSNLFGEGVPPVIKPGTEAWLFGRFQNLGIPPWVPIVLTEFGWDQVWQAAEWGFPVRDEGPYTGIVNSRYRLNREYEPDDIGYFLAHTILGWADKYLRQFPQVRCAYFFSGSGGHYEDEFNQYDLADTEAFWPTLDYIESQGYTRDWAWRMRRYWYEQLRGTS